MLATPRPLILLGLGAPSTWVSGALGVSDKGLNPTPPRLWDSGHFTSPHLPQFSLWVQGKERTRPALPAAQRVGIRVVVYVLRTAPPSSPAPHFLPSFKLAGLRGLCKHVRPRGSPLGCLGAGSEGRPPPPGEMPPAPQ